MTKYDIYNPTMARRIIHTGGADSKSVEIMPHTDRTQVELSDDIAQDLIRRSAADPEGELRLQESAPEELPEDRQTPGMKMAIDEDRIHIIKAADNPAVQAANKAAKKARR